MKRSVIDYIKDASATYGDKTAYDDLNNSLSFREVEEYSSRIATHIIDLKCFHEPVLVLSERNVYTPVVFLGIAMSGCYYVPIDATLNTNRINQIISSARSRFLIINRSLLSMVESLVFDGEIIVLEDALKSSINELALRDVESKIYCQMPLYVIYTSGSTGKPKGVITSHLSLMNYIEAVNEVLCLTSDDVLGNQSPLDYIAAIRDIYLPLRTGSTTIIIPKNEFAMASELANTLDMNNVSVLCWSAAGLEVASKIGLLDEMQTKKIRKVLFSGSILPGRVLKEWQTCFPSAQFINQYGPTEATASCTYYVVEDTAADDTVLPIGTPYRNYGVLLLNEDGTETSLGEVGEICVTGLGVTLGYYGDKELTDKSFIQNPLNSDYREIIYKTGDLGKYNKDGLLLFCGRKDRQIKHLGHRIELEEIELVAKSIEGVDECVALYDSTKEILSLVYAGAADKKQIVLHYREYMPSFMVPRKVVQVSAIPHLPNGKIDMNEVKNVL